MLSIGKTAKMLGVSVETVRNWDDVGKIKSFRTEAGHRQFSILEINRIRQEIGEQLVVLSHCVKVAELKKVIDEVCSKFDETDLITLSFHQTFGYNGISVCAKTDSSMIQQFIRFEEHELLADKPSDEVE
jgi:DNA-binding transcriptional MerR regulator